MATTSKSTMIECQKCKGLNTKESIVCGFCGAKLKPHEGARPISTHYEDKQKLTKDDIVQIILCTSFLLAYVIIFDMTVNAVLGAIAFFIGKKRDSVILEIIGIIGMSLFIGMILLYIILRAWGMA